MVGAPKYGDSHNIIIIHSTGASDDQELAYCSVAGCGAYVTKNKFRPRLSAAFIDIYLSIPKMEGAPKCEDLRNISHTKNPGVSDYWY